MCSINGKTNVKLSRAVVSSSRRVLVSVSLCEKSEGDGRDGSITKFVG